MTATVTNLDEYRASKIDTQEYFQFHEDSDILRRIQILEWHRDDGWASPGSAEHGMVFRKGYDPINHPEDNMNVVLREARRRGII